jgi:tetratricopeptide (TPR) repeat protein
MDDFLRGHHEFGSIEYLKGQLTLFQECSADDSFLSDNQNRLAKVLFHSLNRDATFHDAVKTVFAIASFIYKQDDQSIWQRIAWDALVGALNLGDGILQAQIMTMLSRYHMLEGKHQLAKKTVEQALLRAQEENNDIALLWAYIRFFELFVYQPADFSRPLLIQQVLTLAEKVNQPSITVVLHHVLAHLYNRWGDWERAFGHGQMAYVIARQRHDDYEIARAAYVLVSICRQSVCRAFKHFFQVALTTDISKLHRHDYAWIIFQKSALDYEMGNLIPAIEGYQDALQIYEMLNRPRHIASCRYGLALAQIRLGEFREAQTNLELAEEIWLKSGSIYELAGLRFAQGYLEAWRGNRKLALTLLEAALLLTERIADMPVSNTLRKRILEVIEEAHAGKMKDTYRLA